MRVTRTETNMAYRAADNARWEQLDFILGIHIQPSESHPQPDICDILAGDYPKTFKFAGWHPQCFCIMTPILPKDDELVAMADARFNGEEYTPETAPVTEYPKGFKDFVQDNAESIRQARLRGTEPYFLRDNRAQVDDILNEPKNSINTLADIHNSGWNIVLRNDVEQVKILSIDTLPENLPHGWDKTPFAKIDFNTLRNDILAEVKNLTTDDRIVNTNLIWNKDEESLRIFIKSDGIRIKRNLFVRDGQLIANHELFEIDESLQGKGFAKNILRNFLTQYERVGVDKIELLANYSTGGYAWAKYGFSAPKDGPFGVISVISSCGNKDIQDKALKIVESFYSSHTEDVLFPMDLLVGKEWSKDLLLGSVWSGELNLRNVTQLNKFKAKIGIPFSDPYIGQSIVEKGKDYIISKRFASLKTHDEVATTLSVLLGKRLGYDVEVIARQDLIPLDAAKAYATEIERLSRQYNLQQGKIASIRLGYTTTDPREYGVVHYNPTKSANKTISLVEAFDTKYPDKAIQSSRCENKYASRSTATHEFGHLLYQFRGKVPGQDVLFENEVQKIYDIYQKEVKSFIKKQDMDSLAEIYLGNYGDPSVGEFMAEAFQEYKNCQHPSKYAMEVGNLIDRWFRRK